MSQIGAKIPWRLWFRVHGKAIAQAIPLSFLIVAEARDMYYRASWQVHSIPMEQFATGDVVAICNRWYTMPTWNHVLYSLMSKVLLKSSWDDIAVVSDVSGSPKILFCDFSGAREMPLEEFIQQRRPRGMALRHLVVDKPSPTLHPGVASLFKEEVTKLQARPWYLFNASWRTGHENNYYNFCVQMNQQRVRIKNMISRGQSREAVGVQQRKLQDMEVMRGHLLKFTSNATAFYLFNGSLVSSFLAAYGLVDREQPPPSRAVVEVRRLAYVASASMSNKNIFSLTESGGVEGPQPDSQLLSWDIKMRKLFIFSEKVPDIISLNDWLQNFAPSPHIVPFETIKLTPLFLHAVASPSAADLLGNPKDYIPLERGLTEGEARKVVGELLRAVRHIHDRGIAHGHIQLENVRQHRATRQIVILEHILPITAVIPNTTLFKGMHTVLAPEIQKCEPFSYPADIWSVGFILQQLLVPGRAFSTADLEDTDLLSPFVSGLSGLAAGFLMLCLKSEPNDRPTLAELIQHPFASDQTIETGIVTMDSNDESEELSEQTPERSPSTPSSNSGDETEESEESET